VISSSSSAARVKISNRSPPCERVQHTLVVRRHRRCGSNGERRMNRHLGLSGDRAFERQVAEALAQGLPPPKRASDMNIYSGHPKAHGSSTSTRASKPAGLGGYSALGAAAPLWPMKSSLPSGNVMLRPLARNDRSFAWKPST
jgi:hypothetical protein